MFTIVFLMTTIESLEYSFFVVFSLKIQIIENSHTHIHQTFKLLLIYLFKHRLKKFFQSDIQ